MLNKPVNAADKKPILKTNNTGNKSTSPCLLGALAGDIIGSVYEYSAQKSTDFLLFCEDSELTDDSILTLAVADAILNNRSYLECIRKYALEYPNSGYGGMFRQWMHAANPQPYNSFGNGSAMRVSPVGWAFDTIEDVLREAEQSAAVTHNHPEGIKGAQAIALSIFLARKGESKEKIKQEVVSRFGYNLDETIDELRPIYEFNETCQETVPQAIIAFLESEDFEDAIRKAISLGGDADTLAAITGSIAEAYYGGIPEEIAIEVKQRTPQELWDVVEQFSEKFAAHVG
jgi:ADP-ribosylglycohydrolase